MPDEHGEQTSIRTFHFVRTITAPSTVVAGDKWDCTVFTLPQLGESLLQTGFLSSPKSFIDPGLIPPSFPANIVNIAPRPAGGSLYGNSYFPDYSAIGPTSLDDQVPARIIAGGFEVHNTTPELYRGGSVLVRSTASSAERAYFDFADAGTNHFCYADLAKGPAKDSQTAAADPQARVWGASKGCYVPFRLKLDKTDFQYPTGNMKIYYTGLGTGTNECFFTDYDSVGTTALSVISCKRPVRDGNVEVSSAHFMGLPYETSLEVTVKLIVEFAPTVSESELALVRPAAPYDTLALQAYKNALTDLPPGVEVSFNAKGDWWRKFVKPAVNVAGTALSAVFPEFAPIIGPATLAANKLGDAIVSKRNQKAVTKIMKEPARGKAGPTAHTNTTARNTVANDNRRGPKHAVPGPWIDPLTQRVYQTKAAAPKKIRKRLQLIEDYQATFF